MINSDEKPWDWIAISEDTKPGEYLLFFPASEGRNSHSAMRRIDRYPVSYPRKPSHYMEIPLGPGETRPEVKKRRKKAL